MVFRFISLLRGWVISLDDVFFCVRFFVARGLYKTLVELLLLPLFGEGFLCFGIALCISTNHEHTHCKYENNRQAGRQAITQKTNLLQNIRIKSLTTLRALRVSVNETNTHVANIQDTALGRKKTQTQPHKRVQYQARQRAKGTIQSLSHSASYLRAPGKDNQPYSQNTFKKKKRETNSETRYIMHAP